MKLKLLTIILFLLYLLPSIVLSQSTLQGDLNNDNTVNIFDYNILLGDFGKTGNPGFAVSDINTDGSVNIFDYNILLGNFSQTSGSAPISTTPPSSPTCPTGATCYYVSPAGNDENNGLSEASPWGSFARAWDATKSAFVHPGDTLFLMDGEYKQTIEPKINGDGPMYGPGHETVKHITIKALNDGKAIINGEFIRPTVWLGLTWDDESIKYKSRDFVNPYGNYFVIDGLVAKNSSTGVYVINSRNVILRRCSGYNANPHDNSHVITLWTKGTPANPANVLVEDCIAAGSGRKMIIAYDSYVNVVFRRNFAAWQYWMGDLFCGGRWPQNDGIELYPAAYQDQPDVLNNSIFENNINFGLTANHGTSFSPNPGLRAGNKYLGEISLGAGMKWDPANANIVKFIPAPFTSNPCSWNNTPLPSSCVSQGSQCNDLTNPDYRSGFNISTFSPTLQVLKNNTFSDLFAAYNASWGLITSTWNSASVNNVLKNSTFVNNDIGNPQPLGSVADTTVTDLTRFNTVTNIKVGKLDGTNPSPGNGARLQYRYVDGSLTSTPLWPWPMENRIRTEFADPALFQADGVAGRVWTNFSVTATVCKNILVPAAAVPQSVCP